MNEPDKRSLALHQAIVAKLRAHPERFDGVRERMARYVKRGEEMGSGRYAREWAQAVEEGLEAAVAIALDEEELGQVMRSCTPLTGVLTEPERLNLLAFWAQAHGRSEGEVESLRRAALLAEKVPLYAAGKMTWRELTLPLDATMHEEMLELTKQGLQLPGFRTNPEYSAELQAQFDALVRALAP